MKTSEAIKKITGLSKHYTAYTRDSLFCVMYKGTSAILVSDYNEYSFGLTDTPDNFHKLPYSNKLYMILAEYAMTPIEERKDKSKKYYVKVPYADDAYYWKFKDGVLHVTSNLICYLEDKQFTMKEIKKLGLENYELVEVEE
jgi:hypothetical protein